MPKCVAGMDALIVVKIKGNPLDPSLLNEKTFRDIKDGQLQTREIKLAVNMYYSADRPATTETSLGQDFDDYLRNSAQPEDSAFDIARESALGVIFMLTRLQRLFDRYYDTETMESYIQFSFSLKQLINKIGSTTFTDTSKEILWPKLMDLIGIGKRMLASVKTDGCSRNLTLAKEQSLLLYTIANSCRDSCQLLISNFNRGYHVSLIPHQQKSNLDKSQVNTIAHAEQSVHFARLALGQLQNFDHGTNDSIQSIMIAVHESVNFIESQLQVLKVTAVTPQMFQVFTYHINVYLSRSAKLAHSFKSIMGQQKLPQNILTTMQNFTKSIKALAASASNRR